MWNINTHNQPGMGRFTAHLLQQKEQNDECNVQGKESTETNRGQLQSLLCTEQYCEQWYTEVFSQRMQEMQEPVDAKIQRVLDQSGFAEQRANKMSVDDFLKYVQLKPSFWSILFRLLDLFNKEGIRFAWVLSISAEYNFDKHSFDRIWVSVHPVYLYNSDTVNDSIGQNSFMIVVRVMTFCGTPWLSTT